MSITVNLPNCSRLISNWKYNFQISELHIHQLRNNGEVAGLFSPFLLFYFIYELIWQKLRHTSQRITVEIDW